MQHIIREDNVGRPLTVFRYEDAGPWERWDWKAEAWVDDTDSLIARALQGGDPLYIPASKKTADKAIKDGPRDG